MTNEDKELLQVLISNPNISCKELATLFAMDFKALKNALKRLDISGYRIKKTYEQQGDILLQPTTQLDQNKIAIIPTKPVFRFAAISDTHIGHEKSNINYIDQVYQYCIDKDIHLIFHLGDIIEGVENSHYTKFKNSTNQLQYVLRNYPFQDDILNFFLFGNHDMRGLKESKFNAYHFMKDKRLDFIPVGITNGTISIKKETIALCHNAGINGNSKIKLVLKGHSHTYKVQNDENGCIVYVPTLSKINPMSTKKDFIPSFLDITIGWNQNEFNTIALKHLQVNKQITPLGEVKVPFQKKK